MTRSERRLAMPIVTKFYDEMKELFGDIPYIKASENGHSLEWGKPTEVNENATNVSAKRRAR